MEEAVDASAALDPKLAPLLLFGGHGDATFLYSVPKRALLAPTPTPTRVGDGGVDDMMRGHRWWATAQGWLLMAHRGSPCTFLWDPFTGRRVGLPPDHDGTVLAAEGSHLRRCLLSCCGPMDPTSCVVVVIDLADTELWYCRPGDNHWVRLHQHPYQHSNTEHRDVIIRFLRQFTAIDGKFYSELLIGDDGLVGVLEFSPELTLTKIAVHGVDDDRRPTVYKKRTTCFVESNGELHSVVFSHPIGCDRIVARVGVYRLSINLTTTQGQRSAAWVKVDSLGGRAFFVKIGSFGASLDTEGTGLRGNCVYYSGFNGKVLCVYDMERGTTVVIDPGTNLPYHQSPQVLMPTFSGYHGGTTRSVENIYQVGPTIMENAYEVKDTKVSKVKRVVRFFEDGCTCLPIPIQNTRVTKQKDKLINQKKSKRSTAGRPPYRGEGASSPETKNSYHGCGFPLEPLKRLLGMKK
ncbi:Os02g0599901 [Oryza sativa Japonica Group]|uniref:Os02g0599901 protein n=2 Tax=Oryza sativa subsp. japonica TaxID=39947 RepID=Q6K5I4_ORYSJ|nr:hypothetical protein [Oryza sativa Japonica Group]BAS79594.1 Os02g0599901 [Oryza sativa Japonica Group]